MVRILFALAVVAVTAGEPRGVGTSSAAPVGLSFVNQGIVQAPIEDVWKVWSTPEGWKILGLAKVDLDFRVGGLIRSHYKEDGVLGDPATIQNRILAYEPPRMLAIKIDRPPQSFPFKEAWKSTWTVISLEALDSTRTRLRIASLGFGDDEESLAMRKFFEQGNAWTLQKVQAHFNRAVPERKAP
jgi:uncharacterized protein YndB with AHSA1/START domain